MAKWHYYNDSGERIGPIRGRQLIQFAKQGIITPETFIENESGQVAPAKNAKGLTFSESVQPVLEPNPFTASMPVEPNPFTLPMPVEVNPFTRRRVVFIKENQGPSKRKTLSIWHRVLNSLVVLKKKAVSLYNSKPDVFVAIVGVVSISIVGGIIFLWEFIAWLFRSLSSLW